MGGAYADAGFRTPLSVRKGERLPYRSREASFVYVASGSPIR